jgi:hypothetical protein
MKTDTAACPYCGKPILLVADDVGEPAPGGWLLGWPDRDWDYPSSYTRETEDPNQLKTWLQAGGGLEDGDVVAVGPMTIDGIPGGRSYITQRLKGAGADIYLDPETVFAGDSSDKLDTSVFSSVYPWCEGIRLYGGQIAGGRRSGLVLGPWNPSQHDHCRGFRWWGVKIRNQGAGAIYSGALQGDDGRWYGCRGNDIDAEHYDIGQLAQQIDVHATKGTGVHSGYLGGTPNNDDVLPAGEFSDDDGLYTIYSRDIDECFGDLQLGQSFRGRVYARAENLGGVFGNDGYECSPVITIFDNGLNPSMAQIETVEARGFVAGPMVMTESLGHKASAPVVHLGRGNGATLQDPLAADYFNARGGTYQANPQILYVDCTP